MFKLIQCTIKGLWIKGELDFNKSQINFYWQKRYEIIGNEVYYIDYNGEVFGKGLVIHENWTEDWVKASTIEIKDVLNNIKIILGDKFVLSAMKGIIRHVVILFRDGWGDSLDSIVKDYSDLEHFYFVTHENGFIVDHPEGTPWSNGAGMIIKPYYHDRKYGISYFIGDKEFIDEEVSNELLYYLLVATTPL